MRDFDFLLTPSAQSEAPRSHDSTGNPVFNRAWTLFGVPCVTVPFGKGAHGLPLGVQLVGAMDGDGALLGWVHWMTRALVIGG
jgi:Asp-tRNA(Asn)/Glu-tRNA(Gln) amidotransferase A subunit family amidase